MKLVALALPLIFAGGTGAARDVGLKSAADLTAAEIRMTGDIAGGELKPGPQTDTQQGQVARRERTIARCRGHFENGASGFTAAHVAVTNCRTERAGVRINAIEGLVEGTQAGPPDHPTRPTIGAAKNRPVARRKPTARDCEHSGQLLACETEDHDKADSALNAAYKDAMGRLVRPEDRSALREAQRAWIKARDSECGDEMGQSRVLLCESSNAADRTAELKRR